MTIIRNIIPLALLALFSLACGSGEKAPEKETPQKEDHAHEAEEMEVSLTGIQYKTVGITLGAVEMKQISGTFKANGVLDVPPQQMVSISVPMGGFLRRTELLQGMRVKKGQLIAVIENPDFVQMQQDYLDMKSQLEYAQSDYERQKTLASENINSGKTLEQAKSSFESLRARVSGLRERIKVSGVSLTALEKGTIQSSVNLYAPITGFVTQVNANIGKFINSTDVLFEIVDTEHLHAELTVFEKDIPRLEIGQKVRFTLANETTERTARVYLIGRQINEDRTVRVHCHIDKEDIHLLPGMYLKAIVETGNTQVPALPSEAVVDFKGEKFIFVAAEVHQDDTIKTAQAGEQPSAPNDTHHFRMVPVQTGNSDGGFTEVNLGELNSKQKGAVVTKGAYTLLSKLKNSEEGGHAH